MTRRSIGRGTCVAHTADMNRSDEGTIGPGLRVDRYVLGDRIGKGATSWVFEATHEKVGNTVAIKLLRPDVREDASLRTRFERELHALANIRSHHVPQVHDMGELESEGLPYVVMERLRGRTLRDRLAEEERLPIRVAVELATQLASALAAAHAARIVHRDVKPSNMMLHEESDGREVLKLLDFGICVPAGEDEPKLTLPGKTVGTPDYMSPEQARGMPLDGRSDVFSAGSVLYEMLAGRSPFGGRTPEAIARAVTRKTPRSVRELREDCPPALAAVIDRALEKEADDRFASAEALRDALAVVAEQLDGRASRSAATVTMGAHDPEQRARPRLELCPELDDDPDEPISARDRSRETDVVELPMRPLWQQAAAAAIVLVGVGWGALHVSGQTEAVWELVTGDAGPRATPVARADALAAGDASDRDEAFDRDVDSLDVLARAADGPVRMPDALPEGVTIDEVAVPASTEREDREASRDERRSSSPATTTVLVGGSSSPSVRTVSAQDQRSVDDVEDMARRIRVPALPAPSSPAIPRAEPPVESPMIPDSPYENGPTASEVAMPGNPY